MTTGGNLSKEGVMNEVNGQIFKEEVVACTFSAKHGSMNSQSNILILTDNVHINAQDPKGTLTCDTLTYDGKKKFFKAHGHVQIAGTMGTMGPFDDVWATPHLDKVASPDRFDQP